MQTREDLQSVLDEMFAAERNFSFEAVRTWQKRYPQFAEEIASAVADWREFEFCVSEDEETSQSQELSTVAETAMEKALEQFRGKPAEVIKSLRETAENQGVSRESLLKTLGVSETLMRKIERRNLKEIPLFIEERLADILSIPVKSLQAFFDLPSILSPAVRYKSKNAPQTQPKQAFAEAVKNDPELTDEEKRELLKLE